LGTGREDNGAAFVWDFDTAGCLSLKAYDWDGNHKIYVSEQVVND
jgi:hypothetical protein